jgi:PAS domain S-box-containing protein
MKEPSKALGNQFSPIDIEDPKDAISRLQRQLADTQAQLRQTEQRFALAEENARIGVWDYDVNRKRTYVSPGWISMMGVSMNKAPHEWSDWEKVVHPDDRERVEHAYNRSLRDPSAPYEQEFRLRHASGRYMWVLSRAKALCDAKGKVVRLIGVHIDVTALKEIHQHMREQERTFEELSHIMPQKFAVADRAGRLLFVSESWTQYTGMTTAESVVGNSWLQHIHPEDRPLVIANWEKLLNGETTSEVVVRIQRNSDGLYRWHTCQRYAMRSRDGVVERWYLTATDIHEHRKLVNKLQFSSQQFHALFESNAVGIIVCDHEIIREANDNFLNLVGYTREDLACGKLRYRQMTPPEYHHVDTVRSETQKKHRVLPPFEKQYIRKDGTRVPVLVSCVVMQQEPHSGFAIVIDLSERKRMEDELRNAATQLRATNLDLEHFAHIASHDLREPAHTLSLYLELLSEQRNALGQNAEDMLDCATQACRRLVEQIDSLTTPKPQQNKPSVSVPKG